MSKTFSWPLIAALSVPLLVFVGVVVADAPTPVAVSKVAPADDLIRQVDQFLSTMRTTLDDQATYTEKAPQLKRDAHTLATVALALALHDQDNKLKTSAPALVVAARGLGRAKDFDAAVTAFKQVEMAAEGKAPAEAVVKWEKVAGLGQLMKQATFVNNRLRRNIKRFDARKDDNARDAAVLAVIGQASAFDTHEVKDKADLDKWYQLCGEMRDTAGEVNAAIHAGNAADAETALGKLARNCEECHKIFRVTAEP